jgi:hypothetical protein
MEWELSQVGYDMISTAVVDSHRYRSIKMMGVMRLYLADGISMSILKPITVINFGSKFQIIAI